MPTVAIRSVCREEKNTFLTHLGIDVTRTPEGLLKVTLSDPPEPLISTKDPIAPLSGVDSNADECYIYRGRKTLRSDGYHRYQGNDGNTLCVFKWVNSSSNLLWVCPNSTTRPNPTRSKGSMYSIKLNTWRRGKEVEGAIPVARFTYHTSTFGPEHGSSKLKKWIVHRFIQPINLDQPCGKDAVPQMPVDMTLVLYFKDSGVLSPLVRLVPFRATRNLFDVHQMGSNTRFSQRNGSAESFWQWRERRAPDGFGASPFIIKAAAID